MNHSEALKLKAAEKYLLGELGPQERDQYEDHYFSCQECAEDVKTGAALVDNARQVLRMEHSYRAVPLPVEVAHHSWFAWLRPAYALGGVAAILALAILYQNLQTIPQLKQQLAASRTPAVVPEYTLDGVSRGGPNPPPEIDPTRASRLNVPITPPASGHYAGYVLKLVSDAGAVLYTIPGVVSPELANDLVPIDVPAGALPAGKFYVVVEGIPERAGFGEAATSPTSASTPVTDSGLNAGISPSGAKQQYHAGEAGFPSTPESPASRPPAAARAGTSQFDQNSAAPETKSPRTVNAGQSQFEQNSAAPEAKSPRTVNAGQSSFDQSAAAPDSKSREVTNPGFTSSSQTASIATPAGEEISRQAFVMRAER